MTDLHQTVLARLRTSGDAGLPFWALRPLHESGGAVQEVLRDLEAACHIARDPETERYRLLDDAPVTEPADTLHGLPASLVDVRILTLDDVAEPVMPLDRVGIEVARLMTQQVGILDRLHRLEHPEPVGPIAAPLGVHVEAKREREAIVAWVRALAESDVGCDVSEYLDAIANDVADGKHHTVKP